MLENPDADWIPAAFSQYPRNGKYMGYTMRYGKWRYTEWINIKTGKTEARELYDHSTSAVAKKNLAYNKEYSDLIKKLSAVLDKGKGWKKLRELRR